MLYIGCNIKNIVLIVNTQAGVAAFCRVQRNAYSSTHKKEPTMISLYIMWLDLRWKNKRFPAWNASLLANCFLTAAVYLLWLKWIRMTHLCTRVFNIDLRVRAWWFLFYGLRCFFISFFIDNDLKSTQYFGIMIWLM